jgi:hypothetical protein
MAHILLIILSFITIPFLTLNANATELPHAPDGFTWQHVDEINAAFLLPDNWHYLKEKDGETLGIFITKENISMNGIFDTGITINIFPKSIPAPGQLKKLIERLSERHKAQTLTTSHKPFIKLSTEFNSIRETDNVSIRTLYIVLVNTYTRTSYLFIYESPVSIWDENWPIGNIIVNNYALEEKL